MDKVSTITLYNDDCMKVMQGFKDKEFDLAIVDPPYGIDHGFQKQSRIAKYGQLTTANDWKPSKDYFEELFRVSKNQIIWGYNHLSDMLPSCTEFLFWYKHQPVVTYSDGELAWTSYKKTAICIDLPYFGTLNADRERIHPTQKPIKLYSWILNHYAKKGYKILDTFGGSMSSMIACHNLGYEATCIEIDPTYYKTGVERLKREVAQMSLFNSSPAEEVEQITMDLYEE